MIQSIKRETFKKYICDFISIANLLEPVQTYLTFNPMYYYKCTNLHARQDHTLLTVRHSENGKTPRE